MKKYLVATRIFIYICLSTLILGCGDQAESPKQPQIVRKKIVAKAKMARQDTKGKAPKLSPPGSISTPKSDISKTPAVKTVKKQAVSPAKPKILALKPKSDIAKTPEAKAAPEIIAQKGTTVQPSAAIPAKLKEEPLKPKLQEDTSKAKEKAPPGNNIALATTPKSFTGDAKPHATPPPYNPKGKIDPFEPLFKEKPIVATSQQKKKKKRIPRTPLEKVDLSQLQLVGIILARSGNKALVQEASGKGYIIKKGTYIGLNSGQVVNIQKDNVVIEEEIEDILGKVVTRRTELRLPKPSGE